MPLAALVMVVTVITDFCHLFSAPLNCLNFTSFGLNVANEERGYGSSFAL